MKMKKIFLTLVAMTISLSSVNIIYSNIIVKAATVEKEEPTENSGDPEPRWWPGNPNPFPGSEAWLQQHIDYSSGDPTKSRECLVEAVGTKDLGADALSWFATSALAGVFTVTGLIEALGVAIAIRWLMCMFGL